MSFGFFVYKEGIVIIVLLYFIERWRYSGKMNGEDKYIMKF